MDAQTYPNWQHVIATDGGDADDALRGQVAGLPHLADPRRLAVHLPKSGDYGHTTRGQAWEFCDGDYVGYLDDDDYLAPDALRRVVQGLELHGMPTFLIFPCKRLGERFFITPPGHCRTTSVQYVHRRRDRRGSPIRFTSGGNEHDGVWLEQMLQTHDYVMYEIPEELVVIDRIGRGQRGDGP